MSVTLTRTELEEVTGGASPAGATGGRATCSGVEFDSRRVSGGELFVALRGENGHGHDHAAAAFGRGAALVLAERADLPGVDPERVVVVPDTLDALWKLAGWWRAKCGTPVLAVTGSVGKTTVKEMAAAVLLKVSPGLYAEKSYNNHVGVPYTLCRLAAEHRWAVVELGMNHAGEIGRLSRLVRPRVAVVSKIAPAHIENLGSLGAIADAKLEILEGLEPGGSLVLNGDDEELAAGFGRAAGDGRVPEGVRVVRFGTGPECEARVTEVRGLLDEGISFTLTLAGAGTADVTMPVMGVQNAGNAACAVLAAAELVPGVGVDGAASALRVFSAPLMRLDVSVTAGGERVVDDSYNANPASMKALLSLAADFARSGKRVGLVLGDMLELGPHSREAHRGVALQAAATGAAFVVSVGPESECVAREAEGAGMDAVHVGTPEAAAEEVLKRRFEVLFVKASRGTGLDRTVKAVTAGRVSGGGRAAGGADATGDTRPAS